MGGHLHLRLLNLEGAIWIVSQRRTIDALSRRHPSSVVFNKKCGGTIQIMQQRRKMTKKKKSLGLGTKRKEGKMDSYQLVLDGNSEKLT